MKKETKIKVTLNQNEIKQIIADYLQDREDIATYDVTIEYSQIVLHHIDGEFSAELDMDNTENLDM